MIACERCWQDASRAALTVGGHTADHYRRLIAERTEHPCDSAPSQETTPREAVNDAD